MEPYSWSRWNPQDYLDEYHTCVAADTQNVMKSLGRILRENLPRIDTSAILDFGCGPTLYGILPIGHLFDEIYMADYLSGNLMQIDKWIKRDSDGFNWNSHTRFALQQSGLLEPSDKQIVEREDELRTKIRSLLTCDAHKTDPIGELFRQRFPVVMTLFCADSITNNKDEWKKLTRNIFSLVAPTGLFIVGALLESHSYKVKDIGFPSANISKQDFDTLIKFELKLPMECVSLIVVDVPEHRSQGYDKFLLTAIQKP